jgi:hypothetical protein
MTTTQTSGKGQIQAMKERRLTWHASRIINNHCYIKRIMAEQEAGSTSGNAEGGLYARQRVLEVLGRVRKTGGLPLSEAQKRQFQQWFRTIAARGHTSVDFFRNADEVSYTYRKAFPNPNSRGQYIRALMMYITGLTDNEFAAEYPGFTREGIANMMRKINAEANRERKDYHRGAHPQTH